MDEEAAQWAALGLERSLSLVEEVDGVRVRIGDSWLWNLASNDYLGLAQDPRVRQAAAEAALRWGGGTGASPLVCGWTRLHQELADRLAEFERVEAVALFPTGFAANLGAMAALVGRADAVFLDRLDHASLVAGARLSGARVRVYPHADLDRLESALTRERALYRRVLIATDGVFSMDGDVAPLREIVALAERHGCMTLVDEAHATGVLGPEGRGACALFGVEERVTARVGTLSKALGSLGGFVAGSRLLADRVSNHAPSFMFSTALPPAAVAAAQAALAIVRTEPELRVQLDRMRGKLLDASRFGSPDRVAPIVPIVLGSAAAATRASSTLRDARFLVPAIRPPTVPRGTARLRLSLTAGLSDDVVVRLVETVAAILPQ
jgi:8-amino-7-oxononanoate synthase